MYECSRPVSRVSYIKFQTTGKIYRTITSSKPQLNHSNTIRFIPPPVNSRPFRDRQIQIDAFFPCLFFAPPFFFGLGLAADASGALSILAAAVFASVFAFTSGLGPVVSERCKNEMMTDPSAPVMTYSSHLGRSSIPL
ncbi:hypothetical protein FIBSPDRAFT_385708 [Athelia psychrophila]|uniref:Uncharacterized protein n=1 Tax=Athelia psychrophila TaxID=1759441 RepID=A0A167V736_9AGAM|nr:hypothetical protein FIBSPDRAFT_385708 [Fibularhizoctonia sp. CBS 109695]